MILALLLGMAAAAHAEPFHDARIAFENGRFDEAAKTFTRLAADDDDLAKVYLGWMAYNGKGQPKDYEHAAELYNAAAKAGDYVAQVSLGNLYEEGDGVNKDLKQAFDWYKKAADQGYVKGILNVGVAYKVGEGVNKDEAEAFKLIKQAADMGDPIAKFDLGMCYWEGVGTARDLDMARQWLREGESDFNDSEAMQDIAAWEKAAPNDPYWMGMTAHRHWLSASVQTPPAGAQALEWFRARAKAGDPYAQYALGASYEGGIGLPKDLDEAVRYYAKSSLQGVERAERALKALAASGRVSAKSVARARREAASSGGVAVAPGAAAPAPAAEELHSDIDEPKLHRAERPDDLALVIGVEKYKTLPEARFAQRDAEAARAHFVALGVPERNAVLLTGENATRSKIQAYVEEWLPKNAKPDSRVFVYFSGHGSPDAESKQALLVPWDADPEFLRSTAYPLKRLYASLAKTRAKEVIVGLDACFSGAGGRSVIAAGARPLVTKLDDAVPASLTVFSASSSEQISSSLDAQGHGLFTYYFLKGLDGGAAEKDGRVTAQSLLAYVEPRVADEARKQDRGQTPMLSGDKSVVLVAPK